MNDQKLYDRIMSRTKADEVTGCLNWTGPYHASRPYPGNRYGYLTVKRAHKPRALAMNVHRAMWIALHGEIPTEVYICHRCDNPLCVRPEHLFAGKAKDNTQDMIAKNRHNNGRKTHCKRGHPLSGDNLYVHSGLRHCKACMAMHAADPAFRAKINARDRARRAAKRAAHQPDCCQAD